MISAMEYELFKSRMDDDSETRSVTVLPMGNDTVAIQHSGFSLQPIVKVFPLRAIKDLFIGGNNYTWQKYEETLDSCFANLNRWFNGYRNAESPDDITRLVVGFTEAHSDLLIEPFICEGGDLSCYIGRTHRRMTLCTMRGEDVKQWLEDPVVMGDIYRLMREAYWDNLNGGAGIKSSIPITFEHFTNN